MNFYGGENLWTVIRRLEAQLVQLGLAHAEAEATLYAAHAELRLLRARNRAAAQPEALLERVADVYLANVDHAPAEAVMRLLGCSRRTAARRIQDAEKAGLLPPATAKGKPRSV